MNSAPSALSFVDFVFHHALARPEKPAIILPDRVATYDMMAQGILRAEQRVRALDLAPGSLVCVSLDSPIRHMIVGAALYRLGHIATFATKTDDILPMRLPVAAFLHGPGVSYVPGAKFAVVDDNWFAGERVAIPSKPESGFRSDDDICLVAYSSGTTGRPKPISLSVRAFQQWVMNYYSSLCIGTWERLLLLIGLNSSWGYTIAAHVLFGGRTMSVAFAPRDSLQMISVYGMDAAAATSQQVRELMLEQKRNPVPLTGLRGIMTGGGLFSRPMIAEARARLCSNIVNLLGSTEAGGTAFAPVERLMQAEGATGFVAPWAEVQVVDQDDKPLRAGENGILRIRSTCQGAPYPPERAAENTSFRGGWFYPGDLGYFTPDNLLVMSGRNSDVINVGGMKIAPEVIEDTLRKHPSIEEVAAFGTMGTGGIEEIFVAVVTRAQVADQQLKDWSAERGIPVTRIFTLDTLPKTQSGKVHRDLLKRQLLQGGG